MLVVLMGIVFHGTVFSQSLADLARQQRAKKTSQEQAVPEYTNDAIHIVQPGASDSDENIRPAAPASAAPAAKTPPATSADVQPELTNTPDTPTQAATTDLAGGNIPPAKAATNSTESAGTNPVHLVPPSLSQLVPKVPTRRLFLAVIELLVGIVTCAAWWAVFIKANQPGWAAITPIYNLVVWFRIAAKPVWWIVLLLIPLVGLAVMISVNIAVAKRFGKELGFGIGLTFLPFIFYPVLAWSDAGVTD